MKLLEKHFEIALGTSDGIDKLRGLILKLAVQGRLVNQKSQNRSAAELIADISVLKNKSSTKKKVYGIEKISDEEKLFELPSNWAWARLEQITEYIQRGKGPVYSDIEKFPVISQKCIQWSGFKKNVVKFIDPATLDKYLPERFIRIGDLLWNSTGTGTLGRINIYNGELDNFTKVVADSHVTVVRPILIDPHYVLLFLTSPYIQDDIEKNASGSTNQIELNTSVVARQVIPVPPIEEQIEIVKKVDQLMLLCKQMELQRDKLNTMQLKICVSAINALVQSKEENNFNASLNFIANQFYSLFNSRQNISSLREVIRELAIRGKLVQTSDFSENGLQLFNHLKAQKLQLIESCLIRREKILPKIDINEIPFTLPENWKWVRLGEICSKVGSGSTPRGGKNVYQKQGVKFLRSQNVHNDGLALANIVYIDSMTHSKMANTKVLPNDILLNITGGSIGRSALIPIDFDEANVSQHVTIIRLLPGLENGFFHQFILSPYFQNKIMQVQTGGNREGLAKKNMELMLVPLPPLHIQTNIVQRTVQLFELCDQMDFLYEHTSAKRSEILNSMLSEL